MEVGQVAYNMIETNLYFKEVTFIWNYFQKSERKKGAWPNGKKNLDCQDSIILIQVNWCHSSNKTYSLI